jgi:hypothetical protein
MYSDVSELSVEVGKLDFRTQRYLVLVVINDAETLADFVLCHVYIFQIPQGYMCHIGSISRWNWEHASVTCVYLRACGSLKMEEAAEYCEGCGLEGPIRCIFLCEFHPTAGPKITCQVVELYISSFF